MQIQNPKRKVKVLFNSIPHSGHYISLSRIAQNLADKSDFEVAFSTSEYELQKLTALKQNVKVYGLKDDIEQINKKGSWKQLPVDLYKVWQKQIVDLVDQFQPTMVVCDIFSEPLMRIAKQRKITSVINLPLPIESLKVFDFPTLSKSFPILGLTAVVLNNITTTILPKSLRSFAKVGSYFDNSLVIVSSFFGIQDALSLPPNFRLVGSTICQQSKKANFQPDFQAWLDSLPKDKDIVYVTFGSLARFSQSFVNFLYEGLKKIDVAVIWSLREGQLPQKNQFFFVKKWLPQVQILQMERVKLVITHAGWGGVMECLQAQKPMLCVPVFADQPQNAQLVEKKGIGMILRKQNAIKIAPEVIDTPRFTHQQLSNKVNRLRTDKTFNKNLERLNNQMAQAGGIDQVVRLLKNAAKNGVQHLADKHIDKIRRRSIVPFFLLLLLLITLSVCFCLNYFGGSTNAQL